MLDFLGFVPSQMRILEFRMHVQQNIVPPKKQSASPQTQCESRTACAVLQLALLMQSQTSHFLALTPHITCPRSRVLLYQKQTQGCAGRACQRTAFGSELFLEGTTAIQPAMHLLDDGVVRKRNEPARRTSQLAQLAARNFSFYLCRLPKM